MKGDLKKNKQLVTLMGRITDMEYKLNTPVYFGRVLMLDYVRFTNNKCLFRFMMM